MSASNKTTVEETDLPFALYDAFTDKPYSGSQAAIVLNAANLSDHQRSIIAREIGAPATAFVDSIINQTINVQFFSTVMELPMCGHGTVCLVTRLVALGLLSDCSNQPADDWAYATLDLPRGKATVEYRQTTDNRIEIMLDVAKARYQSAAIDLAALMNILGADQTALSDKLPAEVASADFIHLCLPLRDLDAMRALKPDFTALADFCKANGLETVAVFSTEVTDQRNDLHVRDFCPAVGVDESAAAGTTNAALATYLLRHDRLLADKNGNVIVRAEQGIEIERPSNITSRILTTGARGAYQVIRLQVGGVASRVSEGVLNVGEQTT